MAGQHKIQYDEGDVYEGDWSADGKRHGQGALTFASGARYLGQFVNGFFQGNGILSHPDGSRYEGSFEVGKYHGYGVYTDPSGMKYEGQYQDGRARGLGLVTLADGSHGRPKNEGRFEDSRCVERCRATEAIRKARQAAAIARTLSQQLA